MACPHCGEHLLHKSEGLLRCCQCNRLRQDIGPALPFVSLGRRTPILLVVLLVLPIAFGVAAMEDVRSPGTQDARQSDLAKE